MAEVYEIKSLSTWMSIPATGRWNTYLVRSAHSLAPLLGLEHCSKKLFTLSPRSGDEQLQTVTAPEILARDGYELAEECELSGHPIFGFRPIVRGVEGRPKNLIFASRGPKPRLVSPTPSTTTSSFYPMKKVVWSMTGQLAQTAFSGPSLSLGGTISPRGQCCKPWSTTSRVSGLRC